MTKAQNENDQLRQHIRKQDAYISSLEKQLSAAENFRGDLQAKLTSVGSRQPFADAGKRSANLLTGTIRTAHRRIAAFSAPQNASGAAAVSMDLSGRCRLGSQVPGSAFLAELRHRLLYVNLPGFAASHGPAVRRRGFLRPCLTQQLGEDTITFRQYGNSGAWFFEHSGVHGHLIDYAVRYTAQYAGLPLADATMQLSRDLIAEQIPEAQKVARAWETGWNFSL